MNSGNNINENEINNIFIYDKERAKLTGIQDVESFTDTSIIVTCRHGSISIEGDALKIESFDSTVGDLSMTGNIEGLFYFGKNKDKKNKKRIFG